MRIDVSVKDPWMYAGVQRSPLPKSLKIVKKLKIPRDKGIDRKKSRQCQHLGTIVPMVHCLVQIFENQNINMKSIKLRKLYQNSPCKTVFKHIKIKSKTKI